MKKCLFCGKEVHADAMKCWNCGKWLEINGKIENKKPWDLGIVLIVSHLIGWLIFFAAIYTIGNGKVIWFPETFVSALRDTMPSYGIEIYWGTLIITEFIILSIAYLLYYTHKK